MRVGEIDKNVEDQFPGKKAAILYLAGCNLRCPYCYKPELVGGGICAEAIPESTVWRFLEKQIGRLDGVIFSGGEPTLHEDLALWIRRVREMGFAIKLDTNGTRPEVLRSLLAEKLLDYIAMDVKAPLENYPQVVGQRIDVEAIRTSIWIIKNSTIGHEFRTTVVPGLHTVRELKSIAELLHGAERFAVQDFVSDRTLSPSLRGRPAFSRKPLEDIRAYVEKRVKHYEVRRNPQANPMPVLSRRRPAFPKISLESI